jgi:hypothetical protein
VNRNQPDRAGLARRGLPGIAGATVVLGYRTINTSTGRQGERDVPETTPAAALTLIAWLRHLRNRLSF